MFSILEEIKNYSIYKGSILDSNAETKKTVIIPIQTEWKQLISFNYKESIIFIDLHNLDKSSIIKTVDYDYFNNSEISSLANKFNLVVSESSLYKSEGKTNYLKAGISDTQGEFKLISILEHKINNNTKTIILYRIDSGDSRYNSSLYVHGIWIVE